MGFTPQEVDAMSMWQWQAALDGFVEANSGKGGNRLTEAEADELFDWIEAGNDNGVVLSTPTYVFDHRGQLVPADVVTFTLH